MGGMSQRKQNMPRWRGDRGETKRSSSRSRFMAGAGQGRKFQTLPKGRESGRDGQKEGNGKGLGR